VAAAKIVPDAAAVSPVESWTGPARVLGEIARLLGFV